IATGEPLATVLDALCRFIDERSGLISALLLVSHGGKTVTHMAAPNLPDGTAEVWSTPFSANDRRVLGTFALYSATPGSPSEQTLQLVRRATHLACIAVERHLTEEDLKQSERLLRLVVDALPVGIGVVN